MGRPNVNVNVYGNKSGMTKTYSTVVLKQTKTVAEQLVDTDTIYEIRYDFNLDGETITIPKDCILKFNGGSFSNGILIGTDSFLDSIPTKVIDNVTIKGSWLNNILFPEWFGAKGDGVTDDTDAIQSTIDAALWRTEEGSGVTDIRLSGNYVISDTIKIYSFMSFGGKYETHCETCPKLIGCSGFSGNLIELAYYVTRPSRINIHNLYLQGNNYGIVVEAGQGLMDIKIDEIYSNNLKRVVSFEGSGSNVLTFKDITINRVRLDTNCEIPIYIDCSGYVYGIHIIECYCASTKVGGVFINAGSGVTTPNIIEKCTFDHCGVGYDLDLYNDYGVFAVKLTIPLGVTHINDCYFETDCPLKSNSEAAQTKHGYVEAKTPAGFTYITNPDFTKTGEIIFNGHPVSKATSNSGKLIVTNCHFSYNYQIISLLNGGNLIFKDNDLYFPGDSSYGIADTPTFPVGNSIVKVLKSSSDFNINLCRYINLQIEDFKATNDANGDVYKYLTEAFDVPTDVNPSYMCCDINVPYLSRVFKYNNNYSDTQYNSCCADVLFIKEPITNQHNRGLPSAECSFDTAIQLSKVYIQDGKVKKITFVLLSDITITNTTKLFVPGIEYEFVALREKKTITFTDGASASAALTFNSNNVTFRNVIIIKNGSQCIRLNNSKVNILYVDFEKNIDNNTLGVLTFAEGNNSINICNSSVVIGGTASNTDAFIKKLGTSDGMNKVYVLNLTNPNNIPIYNG